MGANGGSAALLATISEVMTCETSTASHHKHPEATCVASKTCETRKFSELGWLDTVNIAEMIRNIGARPAIGGNTQEAANMNASYYMDTK